MNIAIWIDGDHSPQAFSEEASIDMVLAKKRQRARQMKGTFSQVKLDGIMSFSVRVPAGMLVLISDCLTSFVSFSRNA